MAGYSLRRGLSWVAALTVVALAPLLIGWVGAVPAARTFLVEFGVGLGFVGLGLLALQFIVSGRIEKVAPSWGMDNIIQYHRELGIIGFLLVLGHVAVLMVAEPPFREFFDPRVNFLRSVFLILATLFLLVLLATSLWRERFGLNYEWWRVVHGILALGVVFIGLAHVFQVGHYMAPLWKKGLLGLVVGASMYTVLHTRLVRPWLSRKRPYRVREVQPERDQCWSLILEPEGHAGMRFRPGQFTWITINESPFTLQQHPFSFASSARSREIRLTAKKLGDFTSTWKDMEPGTPAFLEGPFGSFIPDPSRDTGLFMIMGGIGITPAMGILRTLHDDGDRRPVTLIYGNQTWEDITFREELDELSQTLDLQVIHLLEEPHEGWEGEAGFVTRELLEKYLPENLNTFQYFICGPKPLMDIAEIELRGLGVDWNRIYTERFNIV
jgi:predicted ferric reductase